MIALNLLLISLLANANIKLDEIKLPSGFKIELLAKVPNARALTLSPSGTIFIGTRDEGKIFALSRDPKTLKVIKLITLAENLNTPGGVAFFKQDLYFATVDKILRLPNIDSNLETKQRPVVVTEKLPAKSHHGLKFIAFGPDEKLYINIGSPCNVCIPTNGFGQILRMNKDGSNPEVFAKGVRNSVGFSWHPESGELWFTDNGRDMLGDDKPACELNHAPRIGMHFGFPFCHGYSLLDPEFGTGKSCTNYTPASQELGAHVAPLGMRFYTGKMFPESYKNQIFIAEHGSWNRSKKAGYRISLVRLQGSKAISYSTFAEGWLRDEKVWGRPADVVVDIDGSLLVSDDTAGAIYRISYSK